MRITCSLVLATLATAGTAHAEPSTSISTDPIGALYESYSLSVAHMVHRRFALRGDLQFSPDFAYPTRAHSNSG